MKKVRSLLVMLALCISIPLSVRIAMAQNPEVQQKLAELKQSAARNKQALAQYTWQELQTISVKGEVKKQNTYQVHMGPDGKPEKIPLETPGQESQAQGKRHGGPLKRHVVEKKKTEFEDYAKQLGALAQSYAQPDPQRLQQAFQRGNVSLRSAGAPGEVALQIHNYLKPGDTVTFTINRAGKGIQSVHVSSYLDEPKDAMTLSADFAKLADGTNHVSSLVVNGESKKLTVASQNSDYQKM
jgi:hypothetical protein